MVEQQRLLVLPGDNYGADIGLPTRRRKPSLIVDVEIRGDLVVEVCSVGRLSANTVDDQRHLDELWDGRYWFPEDGVICLDPRHGPRRESCFLNGAPDDDA